ncbi:MAG TPA: adenylate/guanylate cyclase domain-containing protein [Candidatus Polarisedimenticolia bacterium]|nr:adenylate/guanylate cyclase domain-containing protein [Candidatus Polarisedimenticolia bacterium]
MPAPRNRTARIRAAILLALVPGILGLGLLFWPPTSGLESSGLDLLFLLRGVRPVPKDLCVVAIDEDSFAVRNVDPARAWPRGLHGELVRVLARAGARAVAFDVLFDRPGDPEQDEAFQAGLAEAGNVVLGSTVEQIEDPRFRQMRLIGPADPLANAAAAVGDVSLMEDRDGVIRSAWLLHEGRPSLALAAYEVATGTASARQGGPRLIDYYGPSRTVPTISLYQALEPDKHLPPGFFKDKIVFVGASLVAAATPAEAKDSFRTPFRGGTRGNTFGVEIHATVAANLLEGRRITAAPPLLAAVMLLLLPVLVTAVFIYLRPVGAAIALLGLELIPVGAAYLAFVRQEIWLPLVIPAVIQIPVAYVTSVIWYYLTTVREREKIRKAFAFYLSPNMIRRIAESPGQLNLGGEEIVGTAMFTDIKGFTSIAEGLTAPQTAALLNDYFSVATGHVFDTGGTLIKYIGDAIFAIWGAPLHMPDHAGAACRAAVGMARLERSLGDRPASRLLTRIGVHTGSMLVGNLGSSQRFDYTAIGDTINLAARLEGINKTLGTRALASGETMAATDGTLVSRLIGRFQVVGREKPVAVFELLGFAGEATTPDPRAIERFARALDDYQARRFREAAAGFEEVRRLCGGQDGASEFYLGLIAGFEAQPPSAEWDGVIRLTSK